MKKFIPSDLDLTNFDKELLKKQLDLETVTITLERDAIKEERYCVDKYYSRKVDKKPNEDGMFKRLMADLDVISQQYGVNIEEVHKIFEECSCSKGKLVEIL